MIRIGFQMLKDSELAPAWKAGMRGHGWPHPNEARSRLEAHVKRNNEEREDFESWVEEVPADEVVLHLLQLARLKAKQAGQEPDQYFKHAAEAIGFCQFDDNAGAGNQFECTESQLAMFAQVCELNAKGSS